MAVLPRLHLVSDTTDDQQGLLKANPLVSQLSQLTHCTASLLASFRMVGDAEVIRLRCGEIGSAEHATRIAADSFCVARNLSTIGGVRATRA